MGISEDDLNNDYYVNLLSEGWTERVSNWLYTATGFNPNSNNWSNIDYNVRYFTYFHWEDMKKQCGPIEGLRNAIENMFPNYTENYPTDLVQGEWYWCFVKKGIEFGFLEDWNKSLFLPENPVSRQEAAKQYVWLVLNQEE